MFYLKGNIDIVYYQNFLKNSFSINSYSPFARSAICV